MEKGTRTMKIVSLKFGTELKQKWDVFQQIIYGG